MNLPNKLTLLRVILAPAAMVFIMFPIGGETAARIVAAVIFILTALTDMLDGKIARKYNLVTNFGKFMDPLADKLTQISLLTILFIKGIIPIWILAIVVLKEFCMVSGASFLYGKELVVSSKWYGKLATVLFYVAMVISLLLEEIGIKLHRTFHILTTANNIIYYLAVITTIASLIMYMKAFYIQGYLKKNNEK